MTDADNGILIRQFQSTRFPNDYVLSQEAMMEVYSCCMALCNWETEKGNVLAVNETLYNFMDAAHKALDSEFCWDAYVPRVFVTRISLRLFSLAFRRHAEQSQERAMNLLRDNMVDDDETQRIFEFLGEQDKDPAAMPLVFIYSIADTHALPLVVARTSI
jgi:hypothetical protein